MVVLISKGNSQFANIFQAKQNLEDLTSELELHSGDSFGAITTHFREGQYLIFGKWKKWNSVFSIKDKHCPLILTFLWSPIKWLTFCQNWSTLLLFSIFYRKTEFPFFEFPYFQVLPNYPVETVFEAFGFRRHRLRTHFREDWVQVLVLNPKKKVKQVKFFGINQILNLYAD